MLLATREMLRAKLRFSLLGVAVGLLIFLILFQQALLGGLVTDFVGAIEHQNAPVLVFNDQARKNVEGSFLFPEQLAAIAQVEGVAAADPVGQNTYTVDAGGQQRDAVLFGYRLGGLGEPVGLVEGRLPAGPDEAVASAADAGAGFALGDLVTIVGDDGPRIVVVGRADDLRWSVAPTIFVSYETFERAQRAVNPDARSVLPSLVAVEPATDVDVDVLTDRIDIEVDGVEALTRREAVHQNPGVRAVTQSFGIILSLAFLVVALVVGFFFLILTVQKAPALTLLRAIGAPTRYLLGNLLAQVAAVLAVGSVVGVALAAALLAFGLSGDLAAALDPTTVGSTLLGLSALGLLGAVGAIRRVLRIDPVSATGAGAAR